MINYISGYKFVTLPSESLTELQATLKTMALRHGILGTILLSTEGINLFLAGAEEAITTYQDFLGKFSYFCDIHFQSTTTDIPPFSKMRVRIKKEIVTMGCGDIQPEKSTAPYIEPEVLKQWYDEQRDFVILDTRNDYEVEMGTFDNAIDLNIENFRAFPDSVTLLHEKYANKPIVTFCTGGIRCEKAAELMRKKGFKNVLQLKGGILHYFEKIGRTHYHGDCFVFDKREIFV